MPEKNKLISQFYPSILILTHHLLFSLSYNPTHNSSQLSVDNIIILINIIAMHSCSCIMYVKTWVCFEAFLIFKRSFITYLAISPRRTSNNLCEAPRTVLSQRRKVIKRGGCYYTVSGIMFSIIIMHVLSIYLMFPLEPLT